MEAQKGHEDEEETTTQKECVEAKKEVNSMHDENDVSNRHMTWWKNARWIRVDSGPHSCQHCSHVSLQLVVFNSSIALM